MAEENVQTPEQVTPPVTTPEVTTATEKKYDDKQVNDLIAKNAAKEAEKAKAELLKELGITDLADYKAKLEEKKKAEEAGKTEMQKMAELFEAQKKQLESMQKETATTKLMAEALKAGIPDSVAEKIALAASGYDGETPADKIKAYITDFPWVVKPADGAPPASGKPFGTKTTTQMPDATKALIDQIEIMTGIKKNG